MEVNLNKLPAIVIGGAILLSASGVITSYAQPVDGFNCGVYGQDNPTWNGSCTQPLSFDPLADADGDGIPNGIECGNDAGTNCADTDGDGLLDYLDLDSDADGVSDADERGDSCSDVANCVPADLNNNSIPDFQESGAGPDLLLRTGGQNYTSYIIGSAAVLLGTIAGIFVINKKKSK